MTHLSELIAALRKGDGNGCERSSWLMQEAADALMANQGAIVNSIIERTRHEPTDDEREAEVKSYSGWDADEVARYPRVAADVIEQLRTRLLDEFHRSEVPEPSAEFCDQCAGPHPDEWLKEYGGHWDTCPNRLVVEMQGDALAAAQRLEVFLNLRDGSSPHDKDVRRVISALRAAGGAR